MGRDDPYLKEYQAFEATLNKHKVKHSFKITEGTHSWPLWRDYLAEFAPLLFTEQNGQKNGILLQGARVEE